MAGLAHALFNGMVPLMGGIDPELAWTICGFVWPVMATLSSPSAVSVAWSARFPRPTGLSTAACLKPRT